VDAPACPEFDTRCGRSSGQHQSGAAVDELMDRVQVAGVGRRLGDHVQHGPAQFASPQVLEQVVRPPGRPGVQRRAGDDLVGERVLAAVEVQDGAGRLVRGDLPALVARRQSTCSPATTDTTARTRTARRPTRGGTPVPGASSPRAAPVGAAPRRAARSTCRARAPAGRAAWTAGRWSPGCSRCRPTSRRLHRPHVETACAASPNGPPPPRGRPVERELPVGVLV
jgi:hypothetical protein